MPECSFCVFIVPGKEAEGCVAADRAGGIYYCAVYFGGQHFAGKPFTDGLCNVCCTASFGIFSYRAIG